MEILLPRPALLTGFLGPKRLPSSCLKKKDGSRLFAGRIKKLFMQKGMFEETINRAVGVYNRPKRGRSNRGGFGSLGRSDLT